MTDSEIRDEVDRQLAEYADDGLTFPDAVENVADALGLTFAEVQDAYLRSEAVRRLH